MMAEPKSLSIMRDVDAPCSPVDAPCSPASNKRAPTDCLVTLTDCLVPCLSTAGCVVCGPWCVAPCSTLCRTATCGCSDGCCLRAIRCQDGCQNRLASYRYQYCPSDANGLPSCCVCPCGPCACCLSCTVFLLGQLDAVSIADPEIDRQRWFGDTFWIGGKLAVASTAEVHRRLLGPMDRGFYIGKPNVRPTAMSPSYPGERLFPLALASGEGAPGNNGAHASFRKQFFRYLMNDGTRARAAPTEPLVAAALQAVRAAAAESGGEMSAALRAATQLYMARTIFWAVFQVDLGPESSVECRAAIWAMSVINAVVLPYIVGLQSAPQLETLHALMLGCPALAEYEVDPALPMCPDKGRFVDQVLPVVYIAALQGVPSLAAALLADSHGEKAARVDGGAAADGGCPHADSWRAGGLPFADSWRKGLPRDFALPFGDRDRMRLVVLETARLNPPVPETVAVSYEPEEFQIGGLGRRAFPPGCPVLLSYANVALDEAVYPRPRTFAPYERASALWGPEASFVGYNGVGDRGDRLCPGRDLSIDILINLLEAVRGPAA